MNDCVGKDVGSESSLEVPDCHRQCVNDKMPIVNIDSSKVAYDDTTGIPLEQVEGNVS
jgi:hypothetical protein